MKSLTEGGVQHPPATVQIRLRSLRAVLIKVPLSCPPDTVLGVGLYTSLVEGTKPFWTGTKIVSQGDDVLSWPDLDFDSSFAAHPGLQGVAVRVFQATSRDQLFQPNCQISSMAVHFSGLSPIRPAQHGMVMFRFKGYATVMSNVITSASSSVVKKQVYLPVEASQRVPSYEPLVLARLLRMQRALRTQQATNAQLKNALIRAGVDPSRGGDVAAAGTAKVSLRQQVFSSRMKEPQTRLLETKTRSELEKQRLRVELCEEEKVRMESRLQSLRERAEVLQRETQARTTELDANTRVRKAERQSFQAWGVSFSEGKQAHADLARVLLASQKRLMSSFAEIFPMQNATLRWISLPTVEEAKSAGPRQDMLGVTAGWVAEIIRLYARVLDVPLRYPLRAFGSFSSVLDPMRVPISYAEFPLYCKGVESPRAEYGMYLLNKNLAQLRWHVGLPTHDLRKTLLNLSEVMNMSEDVVALRTTGRVVRNVRQITPPPNSQYSSKQSQPSVIAASLATTMTVVAAAGKSYSPSSSTTSSSSCEEATEGHSSEGAEGGVEEEKKPLLSVGDRLPTEVHVKDAPPPKQPPSPVSGTPPIDTKESSLSSAVFWGDVTNRTKNLSIQTSFQRKKT